MAEAAASYVGSRAASAGGSGDASGGILEQWQEHAVFAGNAPGLPPSPPKVGEASSAAAAAASAATAGAASAAAATGESVDIQDIDARLENLQAFLKSARG